MLSLRSGKRPARNVSARGKRSKRWKNGDMAPASSSRDTIRAFGASCLSQSLTLRDYPVGTRVQVSADSLSNAPVYPFE